MSACRIQEQVSLAPLNSWRIGGCAQFFSQPNSIEAVSLLLQKMPPPTPITWLGLGSNLLIRDAGIPGLVIHTRKLNQIKIVGNRIYVEAGVACAKIARFCCQNDFIGAEFFAGIPGTIGGALAMNAGAFGGQTWDVVSQVHTIDRFGAVFVRSPDNFEVSYRAVKNKSNAEEGYYAAYLDLPCKIGMGQTALRHIRELLKMRNDTQPIGTFNCGSVFKNPGSDFAARLIEACDLKGFQQGGAIISQKHANFIINSGNASSDNIEQLIKMIQETVFDRFSVKLDHEVRIIGQARSVSRCPKA